jgi:hypothetical protein
MEAELCVCCSRRAVGDVEVSPGLLVGVCSEHLARRLEAEARHRAADERDRVEHFR